MNTSIIITSGHVSDDTWCLLESLGTDGRVVSEVYHFLCWFSRNILYLFSMIFFFEFKFVFLNFFQDKPYKQEQVATAIETVLRKKNSFRKLPL